MSALVQELGALASAVASGVACACGQGAIIMALCWIATRARPDMTPAVRSRLWRLAHLAVLLALVCPWRLDLPILPPAQAQETSWAADARSSNPGTLRPAAPATARAPAPVDADRSNPATSPAARWLIAAWLAGLAACLIVAALGVHRARRLVRDARPARDARLMDSLTGLADRMGLSAPPPLALSAEATGPMLVGLARPTILLPKAVARTWPVALVRMALAHELAHLERRDVFWRCTESFVGALLFFHPLVWLGRRESDLAAEEACDRRAFALTRSTPRAYGELLLRMAERASLVPCSPAVAHGSAAFDALHRRIAALRRPDGTASPPATALALTTGLCILTAALPMRLVPGAAAEHLSEATARLERTLDHGATVTSLAFSPTGHSLLSAGLRGISREWDVQSGMLLTTLAGETTSISTAAYTPDGRALGVTFALDEVRIVDPAKALPDGLVRGAGRVSGVSLSPDGRTLAVARAGGAVDLVPTASWRRRLSVQGYPQQAIAFSPDGRWLASRTGPSQLRLVDALTGATSRSVEAGRGAQLLRTAVSPAGSLLAGALTRGSGGGVQGEVALWPRDGARPPRVLALGAHTPWSLAFSPDGTRLAVGDDARVTVWEARTGRLLQTLAGSSQPALSLAFSPDGSRLATGGADRTVRIWRLGAQAAPQT